MNVFTKITNKFVKLNSVLIFYSTSLLLGFFVFCVFVVVVVFGFVLFFLKKKRQMLQWLLLPRLLAKVMGDVKLLFIGVYLT